MPIHTKGLSEKEWTRIVEQHNGVPNGVTSEEWNLILERRKTREREIAISSGLELAARLAEQWATESGGGSGNGGEGYLNLAIAIRRLKNAQ